MKKIAMYSTSELFGTRITGGLKRFLELYQGLLENGYDVDLYSSDSQEVLNKNNINGYSLNKTGRTKRVFIPSELKIMINNMKTIKRVKSSDYDKVIVFDVPTAFSLSVMNVKNIQLFIRQDLIEYKKISLNSRIRYKFLLKAYLGILLIIERLCLLKAQKVIVQCEYDLNELVNRHILIKKKILSKIRIQINNVNPTWIVSNSKKSEQFEMFDETCCNITFIGDFSDERKGQRVLIDAARLLINENVKFRLNVLGDGKKLESYRTECKELDNILFYGRVKNPIGIIKHSDLVIVPSLADSCPNTIMEALYNEVPVIGALSGGIPEILINSNALFIPTPTDLANKILEVMKKNNLAELKRTQQEIKLGLSFDWADKIITHLEIRGPYSECYL